MARRRAPEPVVRRVAGVVEGVPPELLVGRCVEVWAAPRGGGESPVGGWSNEAFSAWRRWTAALDLWLRDEGLANHLGRVDWLAVRARFGGGLAFGAPWSIETLDAQGRHREADERLARAGVTRAAVPGLREAARQRVR